MTRSIFGLTVLGALALVACDDRPFVTAVDLPLQVIALTPTDGSEGVARDVTVQVRFNLDVVEASVTDSAHLYLEDLTDPAQPRRVEASLAYTAGSDSAPPTATLTPSALLLYSTVYRMTVAAAVQRAADEAQNIPQGTLLQTVTATFTTLHPPPLQLVSSAPGNGTQEVPLDSVVTVTFSEPIRCATLQAGATVVEQFDLHPHTAGPDRTVAGTWACGEPSNVEDTSCATGLCSATFTPDVDFAYSSHVVVTLQGGTRGDGAVESYRATGEGGQLPETTVLTFDTLTPPPLAFVASVPAANTEQVARDSLLTLTFSEALECATVNASTVTVTTTLDPLRGGGTSALAGTLDCQAGDDFFTYIPDAALDWSAQVDITVAGGGFAAATYPDDALESARATSKGGQLPSDKVLRFRAADPPALTVRATTPPAGAEGVPLDSDLTLWFSEPIDCATLVAAVSDTSLHLVEQSDTSATVAHTVVVEDCSGDRVVLDPAPDFTYSGLVTLTVPDSVASLRATSRGGHLDGGFGLTFRAMDPPMLTVTSTSPGGSATTSNLDTDLTVVFSEAIACASVEPADIVVSETLDGGAVVAHDVSVADCSGSTLVLDPSLDFAMTSTVVVGLPATIRSTRATSRGGWLASGYSWVFATADPPDLVVVYTSPGDGNVLVPADKVILVTFSEPVDPSSVGAASFVVEDLTIASVLSTSCGSAADGRPAGTPCSYVIGSDPATVTFTPPARWEYDHRIRFTLGTGIASDRATSGGGNLGVELRYTFEVIPVPPIEVISLIPPAGSADVPLRPLIQVEFNQAVLGSTVVVDHADPALITVWINQGTTPDVSQRVPLDCVAGCSSTGTAFSFQPSVNLVAATQHTFVIKGNVNGIHGAAASAILVDDYLAAYAVTTNTIVALAEPAQGEANVPVADPVCVIFVDDISPSTVHVGSFAVSAINALGTASSLVADTVRAPPAGYTFAGADPATGEPDPSYFSNKVCFVPGPGTYPCRDIDELLPADSDVEVRLGTDLATLGGERLASGYTIHFRSGELETLTGFAHRTVLGGSGPLAGADEIPVNAGFVLRFSAPVDRAAVAPAVELVRLDTQAPIALGSPVFDDGDTSVVLTATALLPYLDDLAAGLELRVRGGASGLRTADGRYLNGHFSARFWTSPRTTVTLSPPEGENATALSYPPAVFSRPMHLPSITSDTFYAYLTLSGARLNTSVATAVSDLDSAVLIPNPSFVTGDNVTAVVTTGAMDHLGNPMPQDTLTTWSQIGSAPASSSRDPTKIGTGAVTWAPGPDASGDQVFAITFPVSFPRSRMLPSTFTDNTLWFEETSCTGGGARGLLGQENRFVIGSAGNPDVVELRASELLRTGCDYQITLQQCEFTNIFYLPPSNCTPGADDVVIQVRAEVLPPDLDSTVPAASATEVDPAATILAVFDENMDPASFDSLTTFRINDGATDIRGHLEVSGGSARFVPQPPLAGGVTYTVTLGAVTDLAGNAYAGSSFDFTVESTPPQLLSATASAAAIVLTFDEAVDPATIISDVVGVPGTIQVTAVSGGAVVYACLEPSADGRVVTLVPEAPLASGDYQIAVTDAVTDLGGTPIVAVQQTVNVP